jgi:hypothetical protein
MHHHRIQPLLRTRIGVAPFRRMDRVGLDVVLAIEEHNAAVREVIPQGPCKLLTSTSIRGGSAPRAGAASTSTRTDPDPSFTELPTRCLLGN